MKPKFLIAAPVSGSGKTTVARGLMALLAQKGYCVQPYKCGPDYIDPMFHSKVLGIPSRNLDVFLMGRSGVNGALYRGSTGRNIGVMEGGSHNMALAGSVCNDLKNVEYDVDTCSMEGLTEEQCQIRIAKM